MSAPRTLYRKLVDSHTVAALDAQNVLLGAVGISGDASAQDEVCCMAGIEAAGLVPDNGDPA